ncbi:MAG TPA: type II toxin-antitoxin system HicA family toxin [Dehalococcoidia bacterium]|nr:type II toxin-antitoxin system HicA family toxin [Dehalococcoidia bacterium]
MAPKARRLTAREAESLLVDYGFHIISQRSSHRKWRHPERRVQVIVPAHRGKTLPVGTLRQIMSDADIPRSAWDS